MKAFLTLAAFAIAVGALLAIAGEWTLLPQEVWLAIMVMSFVMAFMLYTHTTDVEMANVLFFSGMGLCLLSLFGVTFWDILPWGAWMSGFGIAAIMLKLDWNIRKRMKASSVRA